MTTRYQLPQHWTAEQATLIYDLFADITETIWETYQDAILHLWRDQQGIPHRDGQVDPGIGPSPDESLVSQDELIDEDIPW